jgi:hypothetical protein
LVQLWLFVGVPALALGLGMFVGRSRWRSLAGYGVLLAGFGVMTAFHPPSGAILGTLLALLYASGRGGDAEREYDPVSDTGHRAVEAQEADIR